ncbi:hypothetical protein DCS_04368 [Drechmeria coniospora]|uniref:Small secreted protein n=1 Tax=Drechmeria coniospora TaxID=98403 RepID=A0A151GJU5_DRECN|nr:hypothetical protein DCS_04368 [Drechmeria coniospora]KYK57359.1 hypothetical protein DCS_04368 [Drechmeria coniospora]ODA79252.1 hypothetical protein RJ55_04845 [Drechmeria coniospora]
MQLTQTLVATLMAASTAFAAPTGQGEVMARAANGAQWTIRDLRRVCAQDDSSCTWTFGIDARDGTATTGCKYVVAAAHASRANGGPATCGDYTITSGWSGQFGEGNGFTTFSVINKKKQIAWPAYTDKSVQTGGVVKPDLSFDVKVLG